VFAAANTKGIDVPKRVRRYLQRTLVTAALGLGAFPTIARAQETNLPELTPTQLPDTAPALALSVTGAVAIAVESERIGQLASPTRVTETAPPRPRLLVPLYISFAGLQALDAHSTLRALKAGASEANPLLQGVADRPVALVALKAGVTASTIFLAEKLRVNNRVGAVVLMAAMNSAYATIVVHNYRAVP
jgi:hypothetical protein